MPKMLNYTTEIPVTKTLSELQNILAEHGARAVHIHYNEKREPAGISFTILVKNIPVEFRLPVRSEGVYKVLLSARKQYVDYAKQKVIRAQAERTAWRNLKDWILAQFALVESDQAEAAEVFLPYGVNPKTGHTVYEWFQSELLLGPGDSSGDVVDGETRELR
jgi:hypothetical protein